MREKRGGGRGETQIVKSKTAVTRRVTAPQREGAQGKVTVCGSVESHYSAHRTRKHILDRAGPGHAAKRHPFTHANPAHAREPGVESVPRHSLFLSGRQHPCAIRWIHMQFAEESWTQDTRRASVLSLRRSVHAHTSACYTTAW